MVERIKAKGPSQRQQRVAELIRHALAEIITKGEVHDPALADFFPVFSEIKMAPDLKLATVYVSALGRKDEKTLLEILKKNQKTFRHLVAEKVNLRWAPELRFRLDETLDEVRKIEELLHSEKVRQDLLRSKEMDSDTPPNPSKND